MHLFKFSHHMEHSRDEYGLVWLSNIEIAYSCVSLLKLGKEHSILVINGYQTKFIHAISLKYTFKVLMVIKQVFQRQLSLQVSTNEPVCFIWIKNSNQSTLEERKRTKIASDTKHIITNDFSSLGKN